MVLLLNWHPRGGETNTDPVSHDPVGPFKSWLLLNPHFCQATFFRQDGSAANGEAEMGLGRKITISLIYFTNIFFLLYIYVLYFSYYMYWKQISNWKKMRKYNIWAWFIYQIYGPSQHFVGNKLQKYWNIILIFRIQKPKMFEKSDI